MQTWIKRLPEQKKIKEETESHNMIFKMSRIQLKLLVIYKETGKSQFELEKTINKWQQGDDTNYGVIWQDFKTPIRKIL